MKKFLAIPSVRLSPAVALIAAFLSGCGGSSPDPMQAYAGQTLAWRACDPTILGYDSPAFAQLGNRVQCADMRVPLDYNAPSRGDAVVALLRVAAEDPQQRAGAIFFNPGGPGGDGLGLATNYGALWTNADPADPVGKELKQISTRYDLIGFSPRGVGASTRLYCASNQLEDIVNFPSTDRSSANIANMLHNAQLVADACSKNPLTPYINTEQTVRDLDLARSLLGDRQFNFIGYSYGTWLGAWYASRFPERVGRMLLDSSMNFAGTFDEAVLSQPVSMQRVLDQVLIPYASRHPDWFGLGTDATAIRSLFALLPPAIQGYLSDNLGLNSNKNAVDSVLALSAANGVKDVLALSSDPTTVHNMIDARTFSTLPAYNDRARWHAHLMANAYFSTPVRKAVELAPDRAVWQAVVCNDTASNPDPQFWIDQGNSEAVRYPLFGGAVTNQPCLYWHGPAVSKPPLTAATKAAPILMLQTEFDGATGREGAMTAFAALPNAGMITISDEYTHGGFPYGTACVDGAVGEYFLTGKLPGRTLNCSGKPLPGESASLASSLVYSAGGTRSGSAAGTSSSASAQAENLLPYSDPALATQLISRIHDIVESAGPPSF